MKLTAQALLDHMWHDVCITAYGYINKLECNDCKTVLAEEDTRGLTQSKK